MFRIWGRASSVNAQKVLWALEELGVPFERIDAGGKYGVTDSAEYAAMNPTRRVPVIKDGDLVLWESDAILRYLAAREGKLYPEGLAARARADQWMAFSATGMQPHFIKLFWQLVRFPPDKRDPVAEAAARDGLAKALAILNDALAAQAWLTGEEFGIADIAPGSLMHRIEALGLIPEDAPALKAWAARLAERPGYARHVATSFEELRAPGA